MTGVTQGLVIVTLCLTSALSAAVVPEEERSFEAQGKKMDNFLTRTWERISIAWSLCGYEFKQASSAAVDETKESIKDHSEKLMDDLKEKAEQRIREGVSDAVQDTADDLKKKIGPED